MSVFGSVELQCDGILCEVIDMCVWYWSCGEYVDGCTDSVLPNCTNSVRPNGIDSVLPIEHQWWKGFPLSLTKIGNITPTLQFLPFGRTKNNDTHTHTQKYKKTFTMQRHFVGVLFLLFFCTIMMTTKVVVEALIRSPPVRRIWYSCPAARHYRGNTRTTMPSIARWKTCSSSLLQQQQRLVTTTIPLHLLPLHVDQYSTNNNNNNSNDDDDDDDDDTIYALSTGTSLPTAVAVIRISGRRSHAILQQLTPNQKPVPLRKAVVRTLTHPTDHTNVLDQALVLTFQGPQSFTGEDVVELHTHGSRAVVQGILQALSDCKHTRLAERGEFTQRAFGKGKLDLLGPGCARFCHS